MVINNFTEPVKNSLEHQLYILLNTERGTVPLHRDIGIDPRLVDKPLTVIRSVIQSEIIRQVKKYIPELNILSVNCDITEGKIKIECEVEYGR